MITAYILNNKVLDIVTLGPDDIVPDNTVWLDAYKPDTAEREWLTGLFLEEVPDKEELDDIEASARFYWDTDGLHIHSLFPQRIGRDTKGVHVSFTLRNNLLISIREDDIGLVRLLTFVITTLITIRKVTINVITLSANRASTASIQATPG